MSVYEPIGRNRLLKLVIHTCVLIGVIASSATAAQVTLAWDPNTENDLAGYKIHYGTAIHSYSVQKDVKKATTYTVTGLTAGQTYYFATTAYDTSGNESGYSNEVSYSVQASPPSSQSIYRLNSGGLQYTDGQGNVYGADQYFSGGSPATISNPIGGTVDDVLYQSERFGNFSYTLPLASGNYTVVLRFAEIYWDQAGKRVFDVWIEGKRVIQNLDIFARVGKNRAHDVTLPVSVTDGVLNIEFRSLVDNAKVSAIHVMNGQADESQIGYRLNSGGAQYTDTLGRIYKEDRYFSGGNTAKIKNPIDATTDDTLYQSERYGNFSYALPLANGDYTVVLRFAEIYWDQAGKRVFDVWIEGKRVIKNLDIFARVGKNRAYNVTLPVSVTGGVLNIEFRSLVNNAKVSAIQAKAAQTTASSPGSDSKESGEAQMDFASDEDGVPDNGVAISISKRPQERTGVIENGIGGNAGALADSEPEAPVLVSPVDDVLTNTSVALETGDFRTAAAGVAHAKTRWQVFRDEDSTCVLDITSSYALTSLMVPKLVLDVGTHYFWRAQFIDSHGASSAWSDYEYFSTRIRSADKNSNAIADAQQTGPKTDPDRDGVGDYRQTTIESVKVTGSPVQVGTNVKDCQTALAIEAVASDTLPPGSSVDSFPLGLIHFKVAAAKPASRVAVRIDFPEKAPQGSRWYGYDAVRRKWYDASPYARFSDDRKSVTLTLAEGGPNDADGAVNAVLVNAGGIFAP